MDAAKAIAERTADPAQALGTWEEFQRLFPGDPHLANPIVGDAFLRVVGNSNFLNRWALNHPGDVHDLLGSDISRPYAVDDYLRELHRLLADLKPGSPEAWAHALIRWKYRHFFRITLQDVGMNHPHQEVVAQLSDLAIAAIQTALGFLASELARRHGLPIDSGADGGSIPFTVIAMGKLGGRELNFSSDVDLIYFYGSDVGRVAGQDPVRAISPHEYFSLLGQKLTGFLTQKTEEGFLYRVDLDLRPEGKAGVLANSLDAMENYYETFGAAWERQALIKAAFAGGDAKLFGTFRNKVQPFVFPKIADFSALNKIKEMKDKIAATIHSPAAPDSHLKLGDGGIREIEFFVQSFQLLFGGKIPALRSVNTLETLRRLADAGMITWNEEDRLRQAYIYLRTMEHRLQLVEEQQTHLIPQDEAERGALARRMGYFEADAGDAVGRMLADLEAHRNFVKAAFQKLLSQRVEE